MGPAPPYSPGVPAQGPLADRRLGHRTAQVVCPRFPAVVYPGGRRARQPGEEGARGFYVVAAEPDAMPRRGTLRLTHPRVAPAPAGGSAATAEAWRGTVGPSASELPPDSRHRRDSVTCGPRPTALSRCRRFAGAGRGPTGRGGDESEATAGLGLWQYGSSAGPLGTRTTPYRPCTRQRRPAWLSRRGAPNSTAQKPDPATPLCRGYAPGSTSGVPGHGPPAETGRPGPRLGLDPGATGGEG